jgi:hypothetical protein
MLGKILKYELKSTARVFLLLYAALLVVALVNALLLPIDSLQQGMKGFGVDVAELDAGAAAGAGAGGAGAGSAAADAAGASAEAPRAAGDAGDAGASAGAGAAADAYAPDVSAAIFGLAVSATATLYAILLVAVLLMALVFNVLRFYRMLGDEGYLWLTLPVKPSTHILGKLLASCIWCIASMTVGLGSIALLLAKTGWYSYAGDLWHLMGSSGMNVAMLLAVLAVAGVVSWMSSVLQFYASIAVGPRIVKSRLGGSVVAYVVSYIAMQTVSSMVLLVVAMFAGNVMVGGFDMSSAAEYASWIDTSVIAVLGSVTLVSAAFGVVFYAVARNFLSSKLNLA